MLLENNLYQEYACAYYCFELLVLGPFTFSLKSYLLYLFISNVINIVEVRGDCHTPINKCKDNNKCRDNLAV